MALEQSLGPAAGNKRIAAKAFMKEGEMKLRSGMAGAVLLAALLVSAQNVKTDFDPKYDFSQLRTFAINIGTAWGNPAAQEHAREAIARQLVSKGWTQGDQETCDALVVLHGATQKAQTFQAFYGALPHYGWHTVGAPLLADSDAYEYNVGTLVVDIFDRNKRAVFRAVGEDALSGDPGKSSERIDKVTEKMLRNFPPK